jgi:hypothetical protein
MIKPHTVAGLPSIRRATYGVMAAVFVGCTVNPSRQDYMQTTRKGMQSLPEVRQISAIFADSPKSHFIQQLGLQWGTRSKMAKWNTVVWIGGKYELTYQVDIFPDYESHQVRKAKPGRFHLVEIAEITNQGSGASFNPGGERAFGEQEWNKVVAAKGDFSALGVQLKTNTAVEGVHRYISGWQENTWAVNDDQTSNR